MKVASYIQTAIHVMETGAGYRLVRVAAVLFAFIGLLVYYDLHCYHNFAAPEAMDTAQLAKNIADGKGFTTSFIRPFSVFLVQRHNEAEHRNSPVGPDADFGRIRSLHPDIVNAPVYPVLLAGLLKVAPVKYEFKSGRYPPEFAITVLNQVFLVAGVLLTFYLGRRLFDATVGWLAGGLVLGCAPLWAYSISGLSTTFLLLIFLAITACVVSIEEKSRLYRQPTGKMFTIALTAGLLAGLGLLTRYSFGWVIIPVVVFLILFSGPRGMGHAVTAVAGFALMVVPWVSRNLVVSGEPFGLAGFLPAELTGPFTDGNQLAPPFAGFSLEQRLHPTMSSVFILGNYTHKLLTNIQPLLVSELPRLGGSWAAMLFLTGLLMSFRGFAARRIRYFLLFCLGIFMVVQSVCRTPLSDLTPDTNSEDLLILTVPLVLIYAVVFFLQFAGGTHARGGFMLNFLEKQTLPLGQLRYLAGALFVFFTCLPLIGALTSPPNRYWPYVYPPYFPPDIEKVSNWMKEDELMMSDLPWAVAWYGHHQCIWLTSDAQDQFYSLNDYVRPVQAIFISAATMDGKMFTGLHSTRPETWTHFSLDLLTKNLIPQRFPLVHVAPSGIVSSGLFLTDHDRWPTAASPFVP